MCQRPESSVENAEQFSQNNRSSVNSLSLLPEADYRNDYSGQSYSTGFSQLDHLLGFDNGLNKNFHLDAESAHALATLERDIQRLETDLHELSERLGISSLGRHGGRHSDRGSAGDASVAPTGGEKESNTDSGETLPVTDRPSYQGADGTGRVIFQTNFENVTIGPKVENFRQLTGTGGDLQASIHEIGEDQGASFANSIETVIGPDGTPIKALHLNMTAKGSNGDAQTPLELHPDGDVSDYYIHEKIFVPQNVLDRMDQPYDWMTTVPEQKTNGDFRDVFSIRRTDHGPLEWFHTWDNDANGGLPRQEFFREEHDITDGSPGGKWLDVEYYNHRGNEDGRSILKIDGQKVFDHTGDNIGVNNTAINRIFLASPYSNKPADLYLAQVTVTDRPPDGFVD